MPGITGFLTSIPGTVPVLEQMLACLKHDASYATQTCIQPEAGAWTGCVSRLALQRQVWNPAHDLGILIYGEARLDSNSSDHSGWDSFFAQYEKDGSLALQRLNGWFSGVLMDTRKKQTVLFNDRYGLGRVYYHAGREGLFFSSEAKALLRVFPETKQLDPQGLGEWLSCGCVLQNRTLFREIFLLPPGSAWSFSADGKTNKVRYFEPSTWENQPALSPADYFDRLKETFPRILKPYLNGPEPVGMSLTGGLDGRMIMSWARSGANQLPCYTFNGPVRDCADVTVARKVAQACGQVHQALPLNGDFFTEFPKLAEQSIYFTDGAMDVTGAAELYMNRKARQIAPVRLTGNYGSEILRRYVAFRPRSGISNVFNTDCVQHVQNAAKTYSAEASGNRLSFIAFKQVPWHHHARFAVEQSQLTLRSPYLDNDLVSLIFQAPAESAMNPEPSLRLIAEGNPVLGRIPTDRGITYPPSQFANRVQRPIQEFLAKAEYAYDYGMPDWLARIDRYLSPLKPERVFLGRQKFCHFRSWYQRELAGYVRETLLDSTARSRSYLNPTAVEGLVAGHIRGTHNRTTEIHKLLSLELIQRNLLT